MHVANVNPMTPEPVDVLLLSPLPVGASGDGSLIVKATFDVAHGRATLAERQLPLSASDLTEAAPAIDAAANMATVQPYAFTVSGDAVTLRRHAARHEHDSLTVLWRTTIGTRLLVVTIGANAAPPRWHDLAPRLASATRTRAITPADLVAAKRTMELPPLHMMAARSHTQPINLDEIRATTPFRAGSSTPPPPSDGIADEGRRMAGKTLVGALMVHNAALPFPTHAPPRPVPPPRPPPPPAQPSPLPQHPRSRGIAPPASAVLSVRDYARTKVALWSEELSLPEVLSRHDITEAAWHATERRFALTMAKQAAAGSVELASAIRQAIEEARQREAAPDGAEELTVEQFATLRVAVSEADDPDKVLREHDLSAARWDRTLRHWAQRARADSRLAGELRDALTRARAHASIDV